jgi:hypothetical protein
MANQIKKKKSRSKFKHNKKRNTAFLFEALVKELTKASIGNDTKKRVAISSILKKHFKKGGVLNKELDLYRSVNEALGTDRATAERILSEAKAFHSMIPPRQIFQSQTELINDINKEIEDDVYGNFVPNYKNIATLDQIFSDGINMKDRVLLENKLIYNMIADQERDEQMHHINNLTYKTFTKKFNKVYSDHLHEEQKELLSKYILSFVDNGLELKIYLNEEIGRLKKEVRESQELEEVKADENMIKNTERVLSLLESFSEEHFDEVQIRKVLKIQELAREVKS